MANLALTFGAAIVLLLGLGGVAWAADPDRFAGADAAIEQAIRDGNVPGAVLLAGTRDGIVYRRAYGDRSQEPSRESMTLDTVFDLASLSKPIGTATSVLILADRGKVDLQQPVARYLPAFGNHGKERITVEQLLLHHGGLVPDNPMADYEQGPVTAWERVMNLTPKWEPGTHYAYSDVGFIVLGKLVEAVDGRPLERFAREEVFDPLGMQSTTYLPPAEWRPRIAPTEKRKGEMIRGEVHDPRAFSLGGIAGHAGVFSTADDVARWARMLLNGGQLDGRRVLGERTVREMLTRRCLPDGTGCRGYGVDVDTGHSPAPRGDRFAKGTTFGHTGWTGTSFWADPETGTFYVLLASRLHPDGNGEVKELRRRVATACAEALLGSR